MEGALDRTWVPGEPPAKGTLEVYDFEEQKHEPLLSGITDFQLAKDGKTLFYRAGNRLRAIRASQTIFMQRDLPPLQHEMPVVRASQWHGIGDQHQSIATLAAEGNTQGGPVNVDAVADDPCKQPVITERGAQQARLPGVQL